MVLYSYIGLGLAVANICMILILLSIYWKNYTKWKSQYTIGLLVFGIFLLLQNILSVYYSAPPPGPPHTPHGESTSNPPATYKFIPAGSFGLTAQNKLEVGLEHFSLFIS